MVDNINTNTMVGKVVAVCIALLFIVVLAFPIANSLGNMGKEDDGGGTESITYTNTGDFYYKSATADSGVHTISIKNEITFTPTSEEDVYDSIFSVDITSDGDNILSKTVQYLDTGVSEEGDFQMVLGWGEQGFLILEYSQSNLAWCPYTEDLIDHTPQHLYGEWEEISEPPTEGGSVEWTFTIQNGVITCMVWNEDESDSVSASYSVDYFISDSGEYVMANAPAFVGKSDTKIFINSGIQLWAWHTQDSGSVILGNLVGQFDSSVIAESSTSLDSVLRLSTWGYNSAWPESPNSMDLSATLTVEQMSDVIKLISIDYTVDLYYTYHYTEEFPDGHYSPITQFFVPTTVTVEEEGGGSDSNGLGGVASTLIKLVPILLIVSLLLVFIVPMVYKPN